MIGLPDVVARPGVVLVTGTDTDVGKTIATAALALAARDAGRRVAVVKPAQTGVVGAQPGDAATIARLAGLPADAVLEGVRLPEALAPATAARRAGVDLPGVDVAAGRVAALTRTHDVVLVEGAGGVTVALDGSGRGLLDLADLLRDDEHPTRFVVVARAGLGTLNHTTLTCAAIRARDHVVAGLLVGALPATPDLATTCNLAELADAGGAPLLAALPAGLGALTPPAFSEEVTRVLAAAGSTPR